MAKSTEQRTMSNKTIKSIGITFNLKKSSVNDEYEEYDDIETIKSLKNEIEKYGIKTILFEQNANLLKNITKNRPDFVLNIAEGIGNTRSRESQIPCILESLGIPYTGSDPISLGLTSDKTLTNSILKSNGIPVPSLFNISSKKEISSLKNIFSGGKLYIVKPRWEGSSKGIFLDSVVNNVKKLTEKIKYILYVYKQPAIVEEFLPNDEITTGVYGNKNAKILGMMKILPNYKSNQPFIYSLENKRDWREKILYAPQFSISKKTQTLIKKYAIKAFKTLELRDIARVDFRLDSKNQPKIIDINPLPGLSPVYSDLPILYKLNGGKYPELIKIILEEALKRYGYVLNRHQ